MLVLGLGDYTDCGSALLDDGRVVAAINDERLVRQPSVLGIPRESIREVLALAGIRPKVVELVNVPSGREDQLPVGPNNRSVLRAEKVLRVNGRMGTG